ncbi:MAG TPA: AsmA family protein [Burkholderiales bacterium]
MPWRFPGFGRKSQVFLILLVAFAILATAWDWNWFRHPVERYFVKRSHRDVKIADLHVQVNSNLEPTVRLRGVYVENAPWADSRPFASAGEISFTFSLKSISQRRPVVSKLVLIDADIDLERQADGHRNWRLRNPENTAPGRMKVMHLEARNTRIRFIRRDVGFEIVAASAPLEKVSENAGGALTNQILFMGELKGKEFSGEAHTSDVITIVESGESFPIRGRMESGNTRLEVDGTLADLFRPSRMEGKVRLTGQSLAQLQPFVPARLPHSRPYEVEAQLRRTGDATSATEARIKVGGTVLTGDVNFDRVGDRPTLKAALRSESANLADLASLVGMREKTNPKRAAGPAVTLSAEKVGPARTLPVLSDKPLALNTLHALDAEIDLNVKKLKAAGFPALESLKLTADLNDGVLALKPLDLGIAEGHLAGTFVLNGKTPTATADLKIDGRDIRIEKLLAGHALAGTVAGPVSVQVDLTGRGASLADLAGSASGRASVGMENGVITKLADAALELDLGKALRAVISGNQSIPINKIDIAFDFDKGTGHARNIFIDTERTRVVGTGTINLRKEQVELLLTPHPKKPGIFALDKSIHVSGALRKPTFATVARDEGETRTTGAATGPTKNHSR